MNILQSTLRWTDFILKTRIIAGRIFELVFKRWEFTCSQFLNRPMRLDFIRIKINLKCFFGSRNILQENFCSDWILELGFSKSSAVFQRIDFLFLVIAIIFVGHLRVKGKATVDCRHLRRSEPSNRQMVLKTKMVFPVNRQVREGGFDGSQFLVDDMSRLENRSFANIEIYSVWIFEVVAINGAHLLEVVRVWRFSLLEILITSETLLVSEIGLVVRTLLTVVYRNVQFTGRLATTLPASALSASTNTVEVCEVGDVSVDYILQFPLNVSVYFKRNTCFFICLFFLV